LTNDAQSPLIVVEIFPRGQRVVAKTFPYFVWALGFRIFETTIALWLGRPSAQMETFPAMSRRVRPFTQSDVTTFV